jgi:hypothetical protein
MVTPDSTYTEEQWDAIALEGCESLVFHPGKVAAYDLEAYRRIVHRPVNDGQYPCFNQDEPFVEPRNITVPDGCAADHGYLVRIGGFRRQTIFGPCEAADMLAAAGVSHADSLGEGLFENLVLCRRTGILPIFEAPSMGIALPFLETELPVFERLYRKHVAEFCDWIARAEAVYGQPLLPRAGHPWILYLRTTPLMLFQLSARRKPQETVQELKAASGQHRLAVGARTPKERAGQAKAWAFIRRRHMEVHQVMARIFRELAAPKGVLVGNTHTLPIMDYELLGQVFDHPGVAARAGYIEEPALREPYMGYSVRLFNDLSGRMPIMSVRVNTLVSGTRFIPGRDVIRRWFDASVRHGVRGFYFWTMDYPSREGQYFGAFAGNTDPSTRPRERWDAMLDCFRDVTRARCFVPPAADVGILVPCDVLDTSGWRRVLGSFTELEAARIWSRLVPARTVEHDRKCLGALRALVVPSLPFASDALADALEWFVRQGGVLILGDRRFARFDMDGNERRPPAGLDSRLLESEGDVDLTVGGGRVLAWPEPGIGLSIESADVNAALAEAARRWQRIAGELRLDRADWVYQVRADNLHKLTGKAPPDGRPAPQPDVEPRAYMYEHSSPLIIPYIDSPEEFPPA